MAGEFAHYHRGLGAGCTDAIRASDFKANIVTIGSRDKYSHFLTSPVLTSPLVVDFLRRFVAILPRHPRPGGSRLVGPPTALPMDCQFASDTGREVLDLQMKCAILSEILFSKMHYLQISFSVCLCSVFAAKGIIIYHGH